MPQRIATFSANACFHKLCQLNMWLTCHECRAGEGHMDDLIGRVVASTGVDRPTAEKAVGIILQFLLKEGPTEKVRALIERMPGADVAMLAWNPSLRSPGTLGAVSGIMGVGTRMMEAGLSMSQIQAVTLETIGFAREKAGEDAVGEIVGAIPGLGQFV
jgi:hypothetical protein